jgi:hypothetical protein
MANQIHYLVGEPINRGVLLDGMILLPDESYKVHTHSPDGFNWGYGGSGPAQLALAILLELTGSSKGYQAFKWKYIATLEQGQPFKIMFSDEDIRKITQE